MYIIIMYITHVYIISLYVTCMYIVSIWVTYVYKYYITLVFCKYVCHTHVYGISLTTSAEETGMGRILILAILYLPECCYVLWKPLETLY